MKQATYEQLQNLVHQLNKKIVKLEDDNNKSTELVDYWQNIATQQNDCILMQAKRYDNLKADYDNLSAPSNVTPEATELLSINQDLKAKNSELDKMLESYEDSYKAQKSKLDDSESKLVNAKDTIEKLALAHKKEATMVSLLLSELNKFKSHRKDIINKAKSYQPKHNSNDLKIDNIPQDSLISSITKSIEIKFDKLGNYSIK